MRFVSFLSYALHVALLPEAATQNVRQQRVQVQMTSSSAHLCCCGSVSGQSQWGKMVHEAGSTQRVHTCAVQARRYAFKCHRKSDTGTDTVYPVNALAFHPVFGTFASGGVLMMPYP